MMRMRVFLLLAAVLSSWIPAQAAQRTFVASTGSDDNVSAGCVLTAPCRSFQAAHDVVDSGGEVVALDAAGYAPVIIRKSVSILGNPGFVAAISLGVGNAVEIATPGVRVVLRDLTLNGLGGTPMGVNMSAGASLDIDRCVISNMYVGIFVFTAAGVRIADTVVRGNDNGSSGVQVVGNASAEIVRSKFSGHAAGVQVEANIPGTTTVSVTDSVASGNTTGFLAFAWGGNARMTLIRSTASNNPYTGLQNLATGAGITSVMSVGSGLVSGSEFGIRNESFSGAVATFESLGDNLVRQNDFPVTGTVTVVPGL
jgi:hypothetical protein